MVFEEMLYRKTPYWNICITHVNTIVRTDVPTTRETLSSGMRIGIAMDFE